MAGGKVSPTGGVYGKLNRADLHLAGSQIPQL